MHDRDWRTEARRLGFFGMNPRQGDRNERLRAFRSMREILVRRAGRALLSAWNPAWLGPVPDASRPAWAAAVDTAPPAGPRPRSVRVLESALVLSHADELALVKPWVRWSTLTDIGATRRCAASPGEVLLEFGGDIAAAALIAGAEGAAWAGYAVTRGMPSRFSVSTWRMLRGLHEQGSARRVLMALEPNSLAVLCFSDPETLGSILQALAPALQDTP